MSPQEDHEENSGSEPSFEELLAESEANAVTRVSQGEKLKAKVVQRTNEWIHVDIGMRMEAMLRMSDDERLEALVPGTQLDVFVLSTGYEVEVGLDPVLGKGDISEIAEAFESEKNVNGKVESSNPGGYVVNVAGVRCFCPHSQIDIKRSDDPNQWIGNSFDFRVIEFDAASKNVVLSRRRIQQEELDQKLALVRERIKPGATLAGVVREIRDFGAFVDLGGIQGLVHISELSHQRVDRVGDVLTEGAEIDCYVLDVSQDDRGRERISLSLKALQPDPWDGLSLERGAKMTGSIAKTRDFGVFVEIAPNVQGLIPLRFLKNSGRQLELEQLELGSPIEVEVLEWNDKSRQITLALPGWDEEIRSNLKIGDLVQARVVKIIGAGLIVEGVDDPARGLLPKRLLDQTSFKQIEKDFPIGSEHRLALDEIDDRGRYTFAPLSEKDLVDPEVVDEYTSAEDTIKHSPFAAFFKKKGS